MVYCSNTSDIICLKFNNLHKYQTLNHFISTRKGGVSQSPYDSLNLGFKVNDSNDAVVRNRALLAQVAGIEPDKFVIPSQCHSNHIHIVDENSVGLGFQNLQTAIPDTDAIICSLTGICIMVFAADCVPILMYDPEKKVIAAAHAGWKGTVNKIAKDVVQLMIDTYDCNPPDILAGIGPSIGPCCYKIGNDVVQHICQSYPNQETILKTTINHEHFFNLWEANKINLIEMGLLANNIEISGLCTSCRSDLFFSHRKSGGLTGRFGAGIMMK